MTIDDIRAGRLDGLSKDAEAWKVLAKHLEIDEAEFVQWALQRASNEFRDRDLAKRGLQRITPTTPGKSSD
jgi:hypothetical protein